VLIVVRWPVGGIRTWCRYVYRNSVFSSYALEILMPSDPEAMALQRDLADTGVKTTILDSTNSPRSFGIAVARHILKNKWALVHAHGFTSGLVSAIPCAVKRIPHLITSHDVILDWQYRDFRGRMARILIEAMLRSATCIHSVGVAAAENLETAFPGIKKRARPMRVIRNGIDPERFLSVQSEDIRQKYSIAEDAILVGFFGRFMGQKGFRYLVEAVGRYHVTYKEGPPMVVVTLGGGGFQREEEHAVRSLGLQESFRFLDYSPNIAGLMKAVDVVAMPSLWEACGLVAMESLVAGVPLIVSDCGGLMEVCQNSPAKIVPMRDATALLEGILEMSRPERKLAARNFRQTAAERFDVKTTIAGVENLYKNLVKN
jgi:glycosyltransferase involved in cell wall biosynthesis